MGEKIDIIQWTQFQQQTPNTFDQRSMELLLKDWREKAKTKERITVGGLILLTANMLTEIPSRHLTFISDILNNLALLFTYSKLIISMTKPKPHILVP